MIHTFLGLDLGQAQDYTALSILTADWTPDKPLSFDVGYLQRYPLGTSYPSIVDDVSNKVGQLANSALVIDHTGVGRPVFDLFNRAGLSPIGISITGGNEVHRDGREYRVPKRDLIGVLQVAIQSGRLKIARELPEAATLVDELLNFKVKINTQTAHDSYSAWREADHDDLLLSLAMASWFASMYYRDVAEQDAMVELQNSLDREFDNVITGIDL